MLPPRTTNGVRKRRRASAAPACAGAPATRRWWWKGYAHCSRSVAGGGGGAAQRHRMGRQVAAAAVAAVGRAFIERAAAPATRARALAVTMTGRGAKRRGRGHLLPSAVSPRRAALGRRAAGENFPDGCGAAALTLPDRGKLMPSRCRGRRTIASYLDRMVAGIVILKGYGVTASPPSYASSPCIPPQRVPAPQIPVDTHGWRGGWRQGTSEEHRSHSPLFHHASLAGFSQPSLLLSPPSFLSSLQSTPVTLRYPRPSHPPPHCAPATPDRHGHVV